MIYVNSVLADKIESDSRRWNLVLRDQYGHTIDSQSGGVVSLMHTIDTTSGSIVPGDIITQNVNITLKREAVASFYLKNDSIIYIEYRIVDTPGTIPMGKFKIHSVSTERHSVQVTAKDFFYGIDQKYQSQLQYPTTIDKVVEEISTQLGLQGYEVYFPFERLEVIEDETEPSQALYENLFDSANQQIYVKSQGSSYEISEPLQDCTLSEALSYCAGVYGYMLTQSRDGKLTVCMTHSYLDYTLYRSRIDEPIMLYNDLQYEIVVINELRCKVNDSTIYSITYEDLTGQPLSDDYKKIVVEFDNPLMTRSQLLDIAWDYIYYFFDSATIEMRLADPRLDIIDDIEYEVEPPEEYYAVYKRMPITSISYNFDGGLSCTLQGPKID